VVATVVVLVRAAPPWWESTKHNNNSKKKKKTAANQWCAALRHRLFHTPHFSSGVTVFSRALSTSYVFFFSFFVWRLYPVSYRVTMTGAPAVAAMT
jgi:hypothetical protein